MLLSLVANQRGDVADDGRVVGEPELSVKIGRFGSIHAFDIDAFVNGDRAGAGHTISDQHLTDRFGRADEGVHLPVLPARERVPLEVKIHPSRRDERRLCRLRAHRQRQRRHRHGVRIVRVNDVRLQLLDDARQPPGGRQIHFCFRRERQKIETFLCALSKRPLRMRDQHRPVAERSQAHYGVQDLVLSASPRPRRVDVQRKHQVFSSADCRLLIAV